MRTDGEAYITYDNEILLRLDPRAKKGVVYIIKAMN